MAEITLTLALLIAAGLMMRTLLSLRRADLGFVPAMSSPVLFIRPRMERGGPSTATRTPPA